MASPAKGGGTKMTETVAPVCWPPRPRCRKWDFVFEKLAAFTGRDTGDDLRAVIKAELGVARAKAAGDALDKDFVSVLIRMDMMNQFCFCCS